MNRRAFLRTGAASTAILWASPGWCAEAERPPPSDSELLSETRASIERHRKGTVVVQAIDASGKPLTGAKVSLEQLGHEFLFGCNLFGFARCLDADQEEEYRSRFAQLFNYCTLGFYWAAYEPERGKPSYDYTDRVLEWTNQQGILSKGHPLVWDHPVGSPRWLPDDPEQIEQLVRARIANTVSRYRGRIDFWDVVNEATHLPDRVNKTKMAAWGEVLGPLAYVGGPLRTARAANPGATLLVNDYRTDPAYYRILSDLRNQQGFLMDAVGIQSHMHEGVWPLNKLYAVCETYAKLHLPLHFTETTILSGGREKRTDAWGQTNPQQEATQAEHAAQFYTILFAHPAVHAVTWWDFSDYHAWQNAPAGLVRNDMTPKPAYDLLFRLIKKQWWTRTEGRTNEAGNCELRGFHGRYRANAEDSNGKKAAGETQIQRGKSNVLTLTI